MTKAHKKKCFMISPIGEKGTSIRKHADMVLNAIVRPALPDYEVQRADELGDSAMITDKMIEAILNSDLAVADLTDANANVFYEIGLRHMAERPIIHMSSTGKVPFDNAGYSTIFFDPADWQSHQETISEIKRRAAKFVEPGYRVSNPVTQARGSMKLAQSADSRDQMISELLHRVNKLEREAAVKATSLSARWAELETRDLHKVVGDLLADRPRAENSSDKYRNALAEALSAYPPKKE